MSRASGFLGLAALLSAGLSGCAHSVHQYYAGELTGIPSNRVLAGATADKVITAESEQFVILYMTGNTDYVDQAYRKLLDQCPKGEISGVNSRFSTSLGFLSFKNKVKMQGICRAN